MKIKTMWQRHSTLFLLLAALSAGLAWGCVLAPAPPTPTPYPTYTSYPTSTPYPTPTITPDEVFINAIYDRLDRDDTIPKAARMAVAALYMNRPTYLFDGGSGLILQLNVLDVPPSQAETVQAAVQLVGTAVIVAADQGVRLEGIEIIFFTNGEKPFIAFQARPPWQGEQILMVPLAGELLEKIEQKGAVTVTPTPEATATVEPEA